MPFNFISVKINFYSFWRTCWGKRIPISLTNFGGKFSNIGYINGHWLSNSTSMNKSSSWTIVFTLTHTEVCIHIYVYTDVCYTIFYILQTKKNTDNRPKVPVEGWLNEWWLIYIIKYYIFIKKNKVGV